MGSITKASSTFRKNPALAPALVVRRPVIRRVEIAPERFLETRLQSYEFLTDFLMGYCGHIRRGRQWDADAAAHSTTQLCPARECHRTKPYYQPVQNRRVFVPYSQAQSQRACIPHAQTSSFDLIPRCPIPIGTRDFRKSSLTFKPIKNNHPGMTIMYRDVYGQPWEFKKIRLFLYWKGSIWSFFWAEHFVACAAYMVLVTIYLVIPEEATTSEMFKAFANTVVNLTATYSTVLGLVLGFYTSLLVSRFWTVRYLIGTSMANLGDISMRLSYCILEDEERGLDVSELDSRHRDDDEHIKLKRDLLGKYSRSASTRNPLANSPKRFQDYQQREIQVQSADQCLDFLGTVFSTKKKKELMKMEEKQEDEHVVFTEPVFMPSFDMSKVTARQVRVTIVRWLNLAQAIAFYTLYEGTFKTWFGQVHNNRNMYQHLIRINLLTRTEHALLQERIDAATHVVPLGWSLQLISELCTYHNQKFGINPFILQTLAEPISKVNGALADMFLYRNAPIPLAYVQFTNFVVRFYMLLLIFAAGTEMISQKLNFQVYITVLDFGASYFLYVGWLSIAIAVSNPYRKWGDGFDFEDFVTGSIVSCMVLATRGRETGKVAISSDNFHDHMDPENKSWKEEFVGPTIASQPWFQIYRNLYTGFARNEDEFEDKYPEEGRFVTTEQARAVDPSNIGQSIN